MKYNIFPIISLFFVWSLQAQDLHFSQFYNSPQNLNPALVGVFKGDYRATGTFRSQWGSVPVPYQTFSTSADGKIMNVLGNGLLSGGFLFNSDQAGTLKMQLNELALSSALAIPISREASVSFGVQITFSNRNFDPLAITSESQFDGDVFNPSLDNGEDFGDPSLNFMRAAAGFNMNYLPDKGSRSTFDFGFAMYNLTTPKANFNPQNRPSKIPLRGSFYTNGWIQTNPKMDVKFHALWHFQGDFSVGTYTELVFGSGARYHLSLDPDKEKSIAFLTSYRLGDALIPSIEFGWRSLIAAFSYDFNTSQFQVATNRRGGPEFSLIYIFTKVAPPAVFKACPVF